MPFRMLEYYEVLARKNQLEVEQILVYVGNPKKENIREGINHKNLHFHYKVLDLSKLPFKKLLLSNTPNEIVLSILANLRKESPSNAIELIFKRLQKVSKTEEELKDALYFLQILSDLRKFGTDISKKLKAMPVTLDYRKSTIYNEGKQEGKQEEREIVAFELYKMGFDLFQINNATKLTIDYLRKLFNIS
jgi:hypothetical protein